MSTLGAVEDDEAIVRLIDVTKSYGETVALSRVSLSVRKSEFVGLLGPNGAGKSTLLEIVEGLKTDFSGQASVLGERPARFSKQARSRIGAVFQRFPLPNYLDVADLVRLYQSWYPEEHEIDHLMLQLGLSHLRKSRIGTLSVGQQQRLAVLCSLVGARDLLLLDEPTSALDPQARQVVWSVLREYRERRQMSAIISTHQMDEATELCDRICFIDKGVIREDASIDRILARYAAVIIVSMKGAAHVIQEAKEAIGSLGTWSSQSPTHAELRCSRDQLPAVVARVLPLEDRAGILSGLRIRRAELQEAYADLVEAR
ncbi:MAG: ABC transporter ATP-binding protein [Burkholderiales bacterium]